MTIFELPDFIKNPFATSSAESSTDAISSVRVELGGIRQGFVANAVSHLIQAVPADAPKIIKVPALTETQKPSINPNNPYGLQATPKVEQVKAVESSANQAYDASVAAKQALATFLELHDTKNPVPTDFSGKDSNLADH